MSIFISYSHEDEEMVERIAKSLVNSNIYVWIDKCQLNYGDSLIEKIESAITDCSGLLIMLSKTSIESVWCKKEITAGLIRELEERQVLVLPVLLEDCKIPLFLRDKYYADFRGNYDESIRKLQENLLRVTDISMRRVRADKYLIDWALDDGIYNDKMLLHIDSVSFQDDLDYSVYCCMNIIANEANTKTYVVATDKKNIINKTLKEVTIFDKVRDLKILLPDSFPKRLEYKVKKGHLIDIYVRRLGNNNQFDLLFDCGSILDTMLTVRGLK